MSTCAFCAHAVNTQTTALVCSFANANFNFANTFFPLSSVGARLARIESCVVRLSELLTVTGRCFKSLQPKSCTKWFEFLLSSLTSVRGCTGSPWPVPAANPRAHGFLRKLQRGLHQPTNHNIKWRKVIGIRTKSHSTANLAQSKPYKVVEPSVPFLCLSCVLFLCCRH